MVRLQISVVEFLRSGRLSNDILFLQHEGDGAAAAEDDENSRQRRIMQNAVRVSLLLSRSFIHCSQCPEFSDGSGGLHYLSSIQLGDFFVNLEEHDMASAVEDADCLESSGATPRKIIMVGIYYSQTRDDFPAVPQQPNSQGTPMQLLGRLLYSVFSQGQLPDTAIELPTDDTMGAAASLLELSEGIANLSYRQTRQRPRIAGVTVFSQLVDSKILPLSICRFLSGMIYSGPRGKAESPFTSFQDAMQDLEQMISRPRVFLHDSYFPHHGQETPVFGRAFCGRREYVQMLMEITDQMEDSLNDESKLESDAGSTPLPLEIVFVSGIAGSGKSYLVKSVGEAMLRLGWIVTRAKFERGKAYASGGIVSSMFDKVISHLVHMKERGRPADVEYCKQVSKLILDSTGHGYLSWLAGFLPSLPLLFTGIDGGQDMEFASGGHLVYPLSKILEAVLESGRYVMIIADDLQWADKTSLSLISEVLINVGGINHISRRCLFIGLFRHDEIGDTHPFSIQRSYLQMSRYINTNEMKLSGLSKDDVVDIVMTELKLPRRIIVELADAVYKKTSGHALYAIELLNSLVNESIVFYSPQKHSFTWDMKRIEFIKTSENVAELIASNLKSLSGKSQLILQIFSCFGIQTSVSLLPLLEKIQEGMISSLKDFFDRGILDQAGPILIFSHDLILQAVYECMSVAERQSLHLKIGEYLGASAMEAIGSVDNLEQNEQEFLAGSQITSSILSLACDQINLAGHGSINDVDHQVKFAKWNLYAGQMRVHESNFSAASHYFEKGISILGKDCWWIDLRLSSRLHECAVVAAFALGQADNVVQHADTLMDHVLFEDTLRVQVIVLKSLCGAWRYEEGIFRGFKILRQLGFTFPVSPDNEMAMGVMLNTDRMTSRYSIDDIVDLCDKVSDDSVHNIIKVIWAFHEFFWESTSSLTLLACEAVKYTLQHGVCLESATAFAVCGMLKITSEGDYVGGKWYGDVSKAIIKNYQASKNATDLAPAMRPLIVLDCHIDIWFQPLREVASTILNRSDEAMKLGLFDDAMLTLTEGWSFLLHGGEKLSIISQKSLSRFQEIAKYSQIYAKWVLPQNVLLMELTGKSKDYFSALEGSISSMDDLEAEVKLSLTFTFRIRVINFLISYWRGDYVNAEENYRDALPNPLSKQDPLNFIPLCFFGGLVSFHLYRTIGGEDRLKEGKEMLEQMGIWATNSMAAFGNKWLLLRAEHAASINWKRDDVKQYYNDAIKNAQDCGNIHELALTYELFGNYCASLGSGEDSNNCYKRAFVYYSQWGATAVAERVSREYRLDISSLANIGKQLRDSKHRRHED